MDRHRVFSLSVATVGFATIAVVGVAAASAFGGGSTGSSVGVSAHVSGIVTPPVPGTLPAGAQVPSPIDSSSPSDPTLTPPSLTDPAVIARLSQIATNLVQKFAPTVGGVRVVPQTTSVAYAGADHSALEPIDLSGDGGRSKAPVYVIQITSPAPLVDHYATGPHGPGGPAGRVLTLVLDSASFRVTDLSLGGEQDLDAILGRPVILRTSD